MPSIPKLPNRLAILGAGRVGSALARIAVDAGFEVAVAGSGEASKIALITEVLIPGAIAMDSADAAGFADVVALALPLNKFETLDRSILEGKIVIDLMNYWAPIDGDLPAFEQGIGTSEVIQNALPNACVVKAFNHIGYHEIESERRPADATDRRAIGVASDDEDALLIVSGIVERLGFDAVNVGRLRDGHVLESGGPFFGVHFTRDQFVNELGK